MKDTLHTLIASIVAFPDDVSISETEEEGVVSLTITVNPTDMGRIIGKNGKVIRSIRNVMKIPAIKQNKRVDINLSEV
ncbi:MAG: KH domain-containing protein [Candidatus Levybacteria bacterium]|nr:KH domain-containing protein [Candidatus Levybacteria bacterium]